MITKQVQNISRNWNPSFFKRSDIYLKKIRAQNHSLNKFNNMSANKLSTHKLIFSSNNPTQTRAGPQIHTTSFVHIQLMSHWEYSSDKSSKEKKYLIICIALIHCQLFIKQVFSRPHYKHTNHFHLHPIISFTSSVFYIL
jgi:hypothetical protein